MNYAIPKSSLHHLFETYSSNATVQIRELEFCTKINLRGNPNDENFLETIYQQLGLSLPLEPCRCFYSEDWSILWLGPDEWLILAHPTHGPELMNSLTRAFEAQHVAITDVSFTRTIIELQGPSARDVLEKFIALDLHPASFLPGSVVGTILGGCQVFLERPESQQKYRLYVRSSFGDYFAKLILDAMQEFSDGISS